MRLKSLAVVIAFLNVTTCGGACSAQDKPDLPLRGVPDKSDGLVHGAQDKATIPIRVGQDKPEILPRNTAIPLTPAFLNLNNLATESAELSGITSMLKELAAQQKLISTPEPISITVIANRQRFLYLRNKITDKVQASILQIDSGRANIESSIAQIYDLRAGMTERRNRITHRNSQINLISGGVTKMVGYSLALSPVTLIPTNVLEVMDGSVQASLSVLALRQQRREAKMESGVPLILSAFLNDKDTSDYYPPMVWKYLNSVPPGSSVGRTRRQQIIDGWRTTGLFEASKSKGNVSVELLDQRQAMLSDIKAVITQMHTELLQLANAIVQSYELDPTI